MLLGGSSPCQQCGCVSCNACTRTCTEPHTGAEFETVFTNYFEGVEVGNPSDGYLTATGDNDASDPYDGMDGTGPWVQQVSGGFSDGGTYGSGTRFPCTYRFSFWRSTRQLGINNPAPSTALTENVIELTVTAGAVVYPDGTVITPASGTIAMASVPLVSGGAGAVDPRTGEGTVSFVLECQNVETFFGVTARIRWNVQKRQHTLYGMVRECYEDDTGGGPCATFCDGSPPNEVLYLTISNYTGPIPASGSPNGVYVLERVPGLCDFFRGGWLWGCNPLAGLSSYIGGYDETRAARNHISAGSWQIVNGECKLLLLDSDIDSSVNTSYCGTGVLHSGVGKVYVHTRVWGALPEDIVPGSFDWEISA